MNMLALLFLCKRKDYFMAESITDEQILENYIKELKKFNIFKILKLQDMEIIHSNFLAWLLNPTENHGLGRLFFDEFCKYAGITNNFEDLEVVREEGNIDILVKDNKNNRYIIIENKYGTKERNNQLCRYAEYVKYLYRAKDENIIKIYIDIEEEKSVSEKGYKSITYEKNVLPVLEEIVNKIKENSPEQQAVFQYIAILKEKYAIKEYLKNICLNMHKTGKYSDKYKDLIGRMLAHRRFEVMDAVKNFLTDKFFLLKQNGVYRIVFAKNESSYNKGDGTYYLFNNLGTNNDSEIQLLTNYINQDGKKSMKQIGIITEDVYNKFFYEESDKMKELLNSKLEQILKKI